MARRYTRPARQAKPARFASGSHRPMRHSVGDESWSHACRRAGVGCRKREIDYGTDIANNGVVSTPTLGAVPRRRYRSPTRERRARETRGRILAAARTEFLRSGYAATTLRAVAGAAGVSVPTLELVFGTKPALLRAAISFAIRGDADPVPMLQREWARRAQATPAAADFLAIVARVLTDSSQRSAGLVVAAFEAAQADESMRPLADQLRSQRAETAAWIVDGLVERAALRPETDRDTAIDTIWLLMDPHGFCALTEDRGWTPQQFEHWFAETACRLLLEQAAPSPAVRQGRGDPAPRRSTVTRKRGRPTA